MAMINCPECKKSISDKAEKCIECGYPIFAKIEKGASGEMIHTSQKTGKGLKLQRVISGAMMIVGFIMLITEFNSTEIQEPNGTSLSLIIIGGIWFYVTRIRTWWNHA